MANVLVETHWRAIPRMAKALIRNGELTGTEIDLLQIGIREIHLWIYFFHSGNLPLPLLLRRLRRPVQMGPWVLNQPA